MQIENFWVVTQPSENSELVDIVFQADWQSIVLQSLGGLKLHEIIAVYDDENEAVAHGKKLLGIEEIESVVLDALKAVARAQIYDIANTNPTMDDSWQEISIGTKTYDLNIWHDGEDYRATAYDVYIDNHGRHETDTDKWFELI